MSARRNERKILSLSFSIALHNAFLEGSGLCDALREVSSELECDHGEYPLLSQINGEIKQGVLDEWIKYEKELRELKVRTHMLCTQLERFVNVSKEVDASLTRLAKQKTS